MHPRSRLVLFIINLVLARWPVPGCAAHLPLRLYIRLQHLVDPRLATSNSTLMSGPFLRGDPAAVAVAGQATWADMEVHAYPGLYRLSVAVDASALQSGYFGSSGASVMEQVNRFGPEQARARMHACLPASGLLVPVL